MSTSIDQLNNYLTKIPQRKIWSTAAALALGVTALGTQQIISSHHSVDVAVDGEVHSVSFFGNSVSDALAAAGVSLQPKDQVLPALDSQIFDGSKITVAKARPYTVTVDGQTQTVWSTATSSTDILADLSARGSDVVLAASRSAARGPLEVLTHVPITATLEADGKTRTVKVPAGQSLRKFLESNQLTVTPIDRVSATRREGKLHVQVVRVARGDVVTESEIPFKTVKKKDDRYYEGKTVVENEGKVGKRRVVEYRETVDGKETVRTVVSDRVVQQPVDRVELIGTKKSPGVETPTGGGNAPVVAAAPAPSGGSPKAIAQQMLAARGMGNDQFNCLVQLWNRESGWNPSALNRSSGAYGIPQALPGSKMASAGADWKTNPATQIRWGLGYISGRYGTPCGALAHSHRTGWY